MIYIEPKLIRADVLMDHLEKMHKIGILQSIDDIRFAIMDAPKVETVSIEKVERLERALGYLSGTEQCPAEDLGLDEEEIPFCCEEFCAHEADGGVECYRKWIMGEKE